MVVTLINGVESYVPADFLSLFIISYLCWIILLWQGSIYAINYRQSLDVLLSYIEKNFTSFKIVTLIYVLILLIFLIVGFNSGGDQRLTIFKQLRILEPFLIFAQILVFYFFLFNYITNRRLINLFFLFALLLPNMIIGGKSAIFAILFAMNFLIFRQHFKLTISKLVFFSIITLLGIGASIFYNYEGSTILKVLQLLIFRVQMDSDIYYLYFREGLGQYVNVGSGAYYVFGPLFKLLGLGYLVDINIGAQLGTKVAGAPVITGPNAHLPFVLYSLDYLENQVTAFVLYLIIPIALQFVILHKKSRNFLRASLPTFYIFIFNRYFFDPPGYTLMLIELFIFYSSFIVIRNVCIRRS